MRKWITLIMFMSLLMLSGCSFGNIETDKLMHPPRPTGEMSEIVAAIEQVSGSNINFKYPQNGDYRSAIIMQDIDGDAEDEAIAIYQVTGEESITHVAIIDKENGVYVNVGDFKYKASDVDKICFGDVNGNGQKEVFVGWSSYDNSGKTISVCYKDSEYMTQVINETYSDFILADFDEDGQDELLTLTLSKTDSSSDSESRTVDKEANAKLIKCKRGNLSQFGVLEFNIMGKVPMDSSSIKYLNTLFGQIDGTQKGAVVDSMVSGNVIATEIIYWDARNEKLVAPLYDIKTHKAQMFYRESLILSSDVNNDGIIEIPSADSYQYMSYRNEAYILSWIVYNTKTGKVISVREYINNDPDSYILAVPDKWVDIEHQDYKILVKYDSNLKMMTVSEKVKIGTVVLTGTDLISIQVFGLDDWNNLEDKSNDIELERTQNEVYTARILNRENPLSIGIEEVKNLFSLK